MDEKRRERIVSSYYLSNNIRAIAQKPDYIPGSYLQIEENEFDCYLEW
jgi:hypothetical protein